MTTYILILFISAKGNPSLTTAEFHSKESCESAGKSAIAHFHSVYSGASDLREFICVEK